VINDPITRGNSRLLTTPIKSLRLVTVVARSRSCGDRGMVSPCSQPMTDAEGGLGPPEFDPTLSSTLPSLRTGWFQTHRWITYSGR
jgi:hypothetical protein